MTESSGPGVSAGDGGQPSDARPVVATDPVTPDHPEHHVLRQPHADDWAWRRAIRARPSVLIAYRALVLTVGGALVLIGLVMVPLPGPGWLVVFLGLAVLASEFEPAQAVLDRGKVWLRRWETWVRAKPWWVQGLVMAATALFVAAVVWTTLRLSGVPGWMPDLIENPMVNYGGLPRRPH